MEAKELFDQAQVKRNNNQTDEAVSDYLKVREQVLAEGNKWLGAECLHMIGVAYYQVERWEESDKFLKEAEEEFRKLDDQMLLGATLRDRSSLARGQKRFDEAMDLIDQSINYIAGHLGISQVKKGMVLSDQGELAGAEKLILQGIANMEGSPDKFFLSTGYFNLAEVQYKMGRQEEAGISLEKAREILHEIAKPDEHLPRRKQMDELARKLTNEL
ncbi:tetratricopeptide repeat protein [Candidatus Daviesbacteria bacterium]|nr:tetratricopeptide repeat protein [Candidatus Daviesbacteria bacterium]